MTDTSHLIALMNRLSNETARHGNNPAMAHYLESIRKEIKDEEAFLEARGVKTYASDDETPESLDDLLAELAARPQKHSTSG